MSRKINKSKSKKNKRRFRNKRKTMKGGIIHFENGTIGLTTREQDIVDILNTRYKDTDPNFRVEEFKKYLNNIEDELLKSFFIHPPQ